MVEKRKLTAEDAVIIFLIGFGLYQIVGLVLGLTMDTASDVYVFLAYAVPQIVYIATVFVYVKVAKVEFRVLPLGEEVKIAHYGIAIVLGIGMFFFALFPNFGIQKLFALLNKNPTVTVPDFTTPLNIFLGIVIICILPAIGEELLFRKVFTDGFACYGQINAIIISGVLFGLSHLNLAQTVHQIFLGCMLSYLYLKTRNITLTTVIHFGNNFLALFLPMFTGNEPWNNLTVLGVSFAIGGIMIAVSLIYLIKKLPRLNNTKEKKLSLLTIGLIVVLSVLWIIVAAVS